MDKIFNQEPTDFEIERDLANLKALLAEIGEDDKRVANEPNEAYFQNFLYRVHARIEEPKKLSWFERFWKPSTMLALPSIVIISFFAFKGKNLQNNLMPSVMQNVENYIFPFSNLATQNSNVHRISSSDEPLAHYNASVSLILDRRQLKMLKAIINEDEVGVIEAITDKEN